MIEMHSRFTTKIYIAHVANTCSLFFQIAFDSLRGARGRLFPQRSAEGIQGSLPGARFRNVPLATPSAFGSLKFRRSGRRIELNMWKYSSCSMSLFSMIRYFIFMEVAAKRKLLTISNMFDFPELYFF